MPTNEASFVPQRYNRQVSRPPLHPTLVHFPFLLWGMSFVFDVVSLWRGPTMVEAALFNLIAGLAAAMAAAVTGLWDYVNRLQPQSPARRVARWHALTNGCATVLFVASLVTRWSTRGTTTSTPEVPFVLSGLGLALLGVGMYLGGVVAYQRNLTKPPQSPADH